MRLEAANVAVSPDELGTVGGVQLAAVFQPPVAGAAFHFALAAKVVPPPASKNSSTTGIRTRARVRKRGSKRRSPPRGRAMCVQFFISFPESILRFDPRPNRSLSDLVSHSAPPRKSNFKLKRIQKIEYLGFLEVTQRVERVPHTRGLPPWRYECTRPR